MPGLGLLVRLKNSVRAKVKAWGPAAFKRWIWNQEFAEGCWEFIEDTKGDCLYPYVARFSRNGRILDLGCGSGNTGNEVDPDCYRDYVGVDISDVAVQMARTRTSQNNRASKNRYLQGDVSSFVPDGSFDVILFRESIWYIPKDHIREVLDRYRKHLKAGGVFIVRIYDRFGLEHMVNCLRAHSQVVEEYHPENAKDIVMVLR